MSDVLIIASESPAMRRMQEALELDGYSVATAPNLAAALPELYLSPRALRVIVGGVGGETAQCAEDEILSLAAADPGPLGRHMYSAFEADVSRSAKSTP